MQEEGILALRFDCGTFERLLFDVHWILSESEDQCFPRLPTLATGRYVVSHSCHLESHPRSIGGGLSQVQCSYGCPHGNPIRTLLLEGDPGAERPWETLDLREGSSDPYFEEGTEILRRGPRGLSDCGNKLSHGSTISQSLPPTVPAQILPAGKRSETASRRTTLSHGRAIRLGLPRCLPELLKTENMSSMANYVHLYSSPQWGSEQVPIARQSLLGEQVPC